MALSFGIWCKKERQESASLTCVYMNLLPASRLYGSVHIQCSNAIQTEIDE